jgi:hypothetical protein
MSTTKRPQHLRVRLAVKEKEMLRVLAERDGVTDSDWIRLALRRAYAEAFGDSEPALH